MDTQFGRDWSGRRVAVIGLGISNVALIRFLKRAGAELSGRDQKQGHEFGEGLDELESLGIELILGSHYLQDCRVLIRSWSVPVFPNTCLNCSKRQDSVDWKARSASCFVTARPNLRHHWQQRKDNDHKSRG